MTHRGSPQPCCYEQHAFWVKYITVKINNNKEYYFSLYKPQSSLLILVYESMWKKPLSEKTSVIYLNETEIKLGSRQHFLWNHNLWTTCNKAQKSSKLPTEDRVIGNSVSAIVYCL